MTPEEKARQQIDTILSRCGWTVQDKSQMNAHSAISRNMTCHAQVEKLINCRNDELEWCFLYVYWRDWVKEHAMQNDVVKWRRQFEREFRAWQNAIKSWDTVDICRIRP
jgi:hypothetical protein